MKRHHIPTAAYETFDGTTVEEGCKFLEQNCEKCLGGHFINCTKGKCIHGSTMKSAVGMAEGYYWKIRKTYKYIDKVICCSEFMKSKMDSNPIFF